MWYFFIYILLHNLLHYYLLIFFYFYFLISLSFHAKWSVRFIIFLAWNYVPPYELYLTNKERRENMVSTLFPLWVMALCQPFFIDQHVASGPCICIMLQEKLYNLSLSLALFRTLTEKWYGSMKFLFFFYIILTFWIYIYIYITA